MDDPFPTSLPGYESPRIYDPTLQQNMNDGEFNFFDTQEQLNPSTTGFGRENATATPFAPGPLKPSDQSRPAQPALKNAQKWSNSPESSTGSDSSNQHIRTSSSDSSATGDVQMKNVSTSKGIIIPNEYIDNETSNKLMESHFDFDSAASSPIPPSAESKPAMRISSGIRMPYRPGAAQETMTRFSPASAGSNLSFNSNVPPALIKKERKRWSSGHEIQAPAISPENFLMNSPSNASDWRLLAGAPQATTFNPAALTPSTSFQQYPGQFQFGSLPNNMAAACPPPGPVLHVAPLPLKSRVETQSNVKLTIDPLPPNVTKLHLQPYTISKSKLMAKPSPERSSDMYELFTTLVCTSAMQRTDKYEMAMARAAGTYQPPEPTEGRRSSTGDVDNAEDDANKPLNGGPVNICLGCVERERKRAARKKTKNVEEEELWLKDEAKRIVVFNTHEVKEWQHPSRSKTTEGNNRNLPVQIDEKSFSVNAMQIDIPMRIACYCRHQEEKMGFRVIFTIRDYEDNLVAQTMSNSIIITDDHKTHPAPNPLVNPPLAYSEHAQFRGPPALPQPSHPSMGPTPFARNAFSTTDLQGMQHQIANPRATNMVRPFAVPIDPSQPTSKTMTPRNLSRPASPTLPSVQQNKRRKASGTGRVRGGDLVMTKLSNHSTSPPTATSVPANVGQVPNGGQTISPTSVSQTPSLPNETSLYSTNPTTPSTPDRTFLPNPAGVERSYSFENLEQFQDVFSAPNSTVQSRAHTPQSESRMNDIYQASAFATANGVGPQNPPTMANSIQQGNRSPVSRRTPPVMHELTPAEGPKAGGFKVTCLGSGFSQGLEVMFGDAVATTTTYWGETTLVCLVPPALYAGTVLVTLRSVQGQQIASPSNKPIYFKYVDDDQSELMRQMFAVLGHNPGFQGTMDPSDFTRYILAYHPGAASPTTPFQGSSNHRQAANFSSQLTPETLETSLLKCLDWIDLDDSPRKADLNFRGQNGQGMLHLCASLGFYRAAAGLLARGANPDLRDNNGMSPMHMAALNNNVRIIRKLRNTGGDPTLRSLNGFIPADMATGQDACDCATALEHPARSRSRVATPLSGPSRATSVHSRTSAGTDHAAFGTTLLDTSQDKNAYELHQMKASSLGPYSRRNSFVTSGREAADSATDNLGPDVSQLATQSALTAWRDQLSAQIQQFQQTVHRALPPLPNLPDYQGYPVVRRISSLVPQRNGQSPAERPASGPSKEADYHWWELLTGASSAPPAYEDIYPESSQQKVQDKKAAMLQAASEALMDQQCEQAFDRSSSPLPMETVNIGKRELTQQEQARLRAAHAQKMKRLRSDRNLFFFWIPVLILVVFAMLRDRAPQISYAADASMSFFNRWVRGQVETHV